MILDLGPIPAHARRAYLDELGVYFDLTPEADTSPSLRSLDPEGPEEKPPSPTSTPGCLPPFSRWAPAVVISISLSSLACGSRPAASPAASPPLADRGAVVIDALDALVARADRLAATATVASVAGGACAETCGLYGPREIHLEAGRARCVCRSLPNLGVHRLPRKTASLKRSVRSERVGEPGAGEAGAGLAFGGAR